MDKVAALISQDLKHIWHPCSQMKDFETCPPLVVDRAQGSYLYTDRGPLIDGISSWWCKPLGHAHPAVTQAIKNQLDQFEHVIAANTTHPALVRLGEELAQITGKQHISFASDGASAVEIAMKLSIHAAQIKGFKNKKEFIALQNGYHGETFGTMAVSDLGVYKAPYSGLDLTCHFIKDIPYVSNPQDPLWVDCTSHWPKVLAYLESLKERVCALILEPIIQGAGGMLCYSADFLKKLAFWAKTNDIYLIADEIMTGIGRTGTWLACHHADIQADMICLSKGLTAGSIPFSCVMIDHAVYELFYGDADKSFLHSHTFSANPLAVCAALATIQAIKDDNILSKAQSLGNTLFTQLTQIAEQTGVLTQVRGIGGIAAADLAPIPHRRVGYELYQQALKLGALLRPIGNTLYWLPPLNIEKEQINKLAHITLQSIETLYSRSYTHA